MPQLFCRDLKPGDIMLKVPHGSLFNKATKFLQNITGHINTEIVHAGLMFDSYIQIEALGAGIQECS